MVKSSPVKRLDGQDSSYCPYCDVYCPPAQYRQKHWGALKQHIDACAIEIRKQLNSSFKPVMYGITTLMILTLQEVETQIKLDQHLLRLDMNVEVKISIGLFNKQFGQHETIKQQFLFQTALQKVPIRRWGLATSNPFPTEVISTRHFSFIYISKCIDAYIHYMCKSLYKVGVIQKAFNTMFTFMF